MLFGLQDCIFGIISIEDKKPTLQHKLYLEQDLRHYQVFSGETVELKKAMLWFKQEYADKHYNEGRYPFLFLVKSMDCHIFCIPLTDIRQNLIRSKMANKFGYDTVCFFHNLSSLDS
jgi:hypothetical protein